ncbi:hypothetical protein Ctob_012397 [Chrysochromulina tobinii]|uniref:TPM domain-containing protein n=1 Tax=Chrysochromulina tobinii TaxID=1460289 RepID=A0A0M0JIE3_9EUKA|nr:hypothetical protein Ctob_012397 [Chrysochromulina tobinii]|eukprot:KOO26381.1 hypothetical protein Ctob_012397 [Chrysochromulina sp. CCMP291]
MSDDDETEGSAVRRRGSDEPASAQLASAPSTAGPPPATRRKRKKKPAGSKWLNRLLAIGCCASLIPLGLEFWWSLRPDHMGKPKKDDPWVRVIDAAPPEEALRARRNRRIDAALANRTLGANRTSERRGVGGMHRIWRTVPGGVHDVIEGEGDERVVYSVDALLAPTTANGSYVVDPTDALDPLTLTYLNRNLTWVDRLTPFRVVVAVVARRAYATQILRHWYYGTRMYERSALVVLSRDGLVEIAVGRQTRMVFDEVVAHHFAVRAMEMLARHNASETEPSRALLQETAQKLIFYISFTVRSRTQATVVSMRSMSMFMMFFMMITISATKQQQARRYAELYGYRHDPYGRGFYLGPGIHGRADFWEEFESGRRGGDFYAEERSRSCDDGAPRTAARH